MRCPRCHQENRDEARFRAACGSSLAAQCPAYGHQPPPGAALCDHCRTPVAGSAPAAISPPLASRPQLLSAIGQTTHLAARMKRPATPGNIRRQAHMRQNVSRLLGVHGDTISRWLAIDAVGGLTAFLATYILGGKAVSLAPAVLASLEQALHRPAGFASNEALRQWVRRTHGVEASTRRSTHWYAHASMPNSKCHTRVTQNNPAAIPALQARRYGHLQRAIPPANTRPVHVFSRDESRFGLLTVRGRRLMASGVQSVGTIQHAFEWFSVDGAVGPTTSDRFFLELSSLNVEMFQLFVNAFAQAFYDSLNLPLLDNSGAHTAPRLTSPENMRLVVLPPYGPELNPIERVWRDLKDALAWLQFPPLGG
jgi:DDE superfamily endonuclease